MAIRLFLVMALVLGASAAQAENGLLYLGAGIANDNLKDVAATDSSHGSTNWKALAGLRPLRLLAVEADYMELGGTTVYYATPAIVPFPGGPVSTHVSYKAFTGYAVGYAPIPLPHLDVFGKMGLARWSARGGTKAIGAGGVSQFFYLSDDGTEFAWGASAQVHVGNIGARLEYGSFRIPSTNGAKIVSLTVFLNLY